VAARESLLIPERARIGKAALAELPDDGAIVLDAGTTTRRLADMLPTDVELTVVVNSPQLATILARRSNLTVMILGGRVRGRTVAAVGDWAIAALATIHVDVAFMATNGISVERGLTTPDPTEAATKAAMIAAARRTVVLADPLRSATTTSPASATSTRSTRSSPTPAPRPSSSTRSPRPGRGWCSRDHHPHAQPQPPHGRTAGTDPATHSALCRRSLGRSCSGRGRVPDSASAFMLDPAGTPKHATGRRPTGPRVVRK
jgi:hypothetical protein